MTAKKLVIHLGDQQRKYLTGIINTGRWTNNERKRAEILLIADEHKDYSFNTIATLLCCGRKRIADRELLIKEVDAVEKRRNAGKNRINWQFTRQKAKEWLNRFKIKRE